MTEWLFDERVDERAVRRSVMEQTGFAERGQGTGQSLPDPPALAVRLYDLIIHDNRKWFDLFKGADIRLDAVVVQGNVLARKPEAAYVPATFRFPEVRDGEALSTDGLLIYFGRPRNFLDIAVMVSRDRGDSDDLATLLATRSKDPGFRAAMAGLLGVAVAAPQAAAVMAAIEAARVLGDLAYRAIRAASGTTIGLYRGSRLAYPDDFGRGRNPAEGAYLKQHLSFWYQIDDADTVPTR